MQHHGRLDGPAPRGQKAPHAGGEQQGRGPPTGVRPQDMLPDLTISLAQAAEDAQGQCCCGTGGPACLYSRDRPDYRSFLVCRTQQYHCGAGSSFKAGAAGDAAQVLMQGGECNAGSFSTL